MYIFKFLDKLSLTLRPPYCIFTLDFQTQQINKNERHLKAVWFTHMNIWIHIKCTRTYCPLAAWTITILISHVGSKVAGLLLKLIQTLWLIIDPKPDMHMFTPLFSTSDQHPALWVGHYGLGPPSTHSNILHNTWFFWVFSYFIFLCVYFRKRNIYNRDDGGQHLSDSLPLSPSLYTKHTMCFGVYGLRAQRGLCSSWVRVWFLEIRIYVEFCKWCTCCKFHPPWCKRIW